MEDLRHNSTSFKDLAEECNTRIDHLWLGMMKPLIKPSGPRHEPRLDNKFEWTLKDLMEEVGR